MDSNSTLLSNHQNFNMVNVGGNNSATDNSEKYIRRQAKIIENNNQNVPKSYTPPYEFMYTSPQINQAMIPNKEVPNERYDELTDYLYKNGLIDRNNVVRYEINYLNINSKDRRKTATIIIK